MLLVRNNKSIKTFLVLKVAAIVMFPYNTCLPDNLITSLDQIELRKQQSLSWINPSKIIPQIQPELGKSSAL